MSAVYGYVTERILAQLEKGVVPWRKPWATGDAIRYASGKPYRGINQMLLGGGEYITRKQIKALGGRWKDNVKPDIAVFYTTWVPKSKTDEVDEHVRHFGVLRYYEVFPLCATEGIPSKLDTTLKVHEPIPEAQAIIAGWQDGPAIEHLQQDKACFSPWLDTVTMPVMGQFRTAEEYYSTLFHELSHATGLQKRLKRFTNDQSGAFGSQSYSKEELIAEMGAAMLCYQCGIETTLENSAAYIDNWRRRLSEDVKLVVIAAGAAQKACDLILGRTYAQQQEEAA